jgi:hypothetical protein
MGESLSPEGAGAVIGRSEVDIIGLSNGLAVGSWRSLSATTTIPRFEISPCVRLPPILFVLMEDLTHA